jgi:Protein of unknown function (DUF3800)
MFHIYCDESCHLERADDKAMVLGAVRCPADKRREASVALRAIKIRHGLAPSFELKWTKVSPAKVAYYTDVLDYFIDNPDLAFRAVVVSDKSKLRHADFGQTHDDFYYKLYFQLIRHWLDEDHQFRIFLDIKDTRSWVKTLRLQEVLANSHYDFHRDIVRSIELVRSEQVEFVQLTDLLTGCVSYANRALTTNAGKVALVAHLRHRSSFKLTATTLASARKVNIFVWQPREAAL